MFDKNNFAKLLNKAKGNRSVNKYAEDCGVSSAHISRLLRELINTAPGPETLKKFAECSQNNVTYEQFMEVAGFIELYSDNKNLHNIDKEKLREFVINHIYENPEVKRVSIENYDGDINNVPIDHILGSITQNNNNETVSIKFKNLNIEKVNTDKDQQLFNIDDKKFVPIPIVGIIRAGQPILAEENLGGYFPTDRQFIPNDREYFYLRIKGDSMDKEFKESSLVLVQKQEYIENGEIGVVLVNGYDATVKKIFIKDNLITLMPQSSNPEHQPQIYDMSKEEVKILGKVVLAVKKY